MRWSLARGNTLGEHILFAASLRVVRRWFGSENSLVGCDYLPDSSILRRLPTGDQVRGAGWSQPVGDSGGGGPGSKAKRLTAARTRIWLVRVWDRGWSGLQVAAQAAQRKANSSGWLEQRCGGSRHDLWALSMQSPRSRHIDPAGADATTARLVSRHSVPGHTTWYERKHSRFVSRRDLHISARTSATFGQRQFFWCIRRPRGLQAHSHLAPSPVSRR